MRLCCFPSRPLPAASMTARAPFSGGNIQTGGATDPITPKRLQEVGQLLEDKKPWPAFLHAGLKARGGWDGCPDGVEEALNWMASAAVGLLDAASVGPLKPVCKAFTALIEAAEGAIEVVDILKDLVSWGAFLVGVFIEHGKQVENLKAVTKPLNEFVSTTDELAKCAKVVAGRGKLMALLRHKKDAKMIASFDGKLRRLWTDITGVTILDIQENVRRLEERSRPLPPPDMADLPAAALMLPSSHVKRAGLESDVVKALTATDAAGAPYVLTGMGGAGKSVLASSIVRNEEVRGHFGQISWLRVGPGGNGQLQALLEGLAREASPAGKLPPRFNSADEIIQHLTLVVAEDTLPRLLVLDDVWEREVVEALQPTGFQLLVTARLGSVVSTAGGQTIVGDMGREEARELLKSRSGAVALPETEADQVAEACGRHALTLAIAGSMQCITSSPNSAPAWRKLSEEIAQKKRTALGPEMDAYVGGDDLTKRSLFSVLQLSLVSMGRDEKRLFLSLVVLAPGVLVPTAMLASIWQKDNRGAMKEAEFFVRNSLLQEVDDSFRLHDLLLDFIRIMCQGEAALVAEAVERQIQYLGRLDVLRGYSDKGESLEGYYSLIWLWQKLVDLSGDEDLEVDVYSKGLRELGDDESTDTADMYRVVAWLLQLQGKLKQAGQLYRHSLNILEKELGTDDPDVATSLNNLALLLTSQGEYDEAGELYKRCQAINEKALGPEHPSLATMLGNRAGLLKAQGEYDETEELYKRCQAIEEKALGPEHPSLATTLGNRAGLLEAQGEYDEAGELYKRCQAIKEKALGPEHPSLATTLNNRAGLLRAQGEYDEAGELYKRCQAIKEKALGPEHPSLATTLCNRAGLLEAQGEYDEAGELYKRCQAIQEKALGPEHPSLATTLNNRAGLLQAQGEYDEAGELYKRCQAIQEKALGPEHPSLATTLNNRAELLRAQGEYDEAGELYKRCQAIKEKALGPEHPSLATTLCNRAGLLQAQGEHDEAGELYKRCQAIEEKALGPEHPSLAITLYNRAELLKAQGKHDAAIQLWERALFIFRKKLGETHEYTVATQKKLEPARRQTQAQADTE